MEQNPNRRRQALRLLRIALIAFGLLVLTVVLHPQRMLPPDMTLGEFFQAMIGVLMLSGLMAAVVRILFHLDLRMNTPSGLILSQQA